MELYVYRNKTLGIWFAQKHYGPTIERHDGTVWQYSHQLTLEPLTGEEYQSGIMVSGDNVNTMTLYEVTMGTAE